MLQRTVLVIEDDRVLADLLAQVLETEGFRAVVAGGIPEAEDIARRSLPDMVLTDLWASVYSESAWEPIARLKQVIDGTPIVVCTAHSRAADEDYGARGVCEVVTKPFDLEDVVLSVKRALGLSGCSARAPGDPATAQPA